MNTSVGSPADMRNTTTHGTSIISLPGAQQLWNQWEIQCLVLASFSLQVFLLFFSGMRKRRRSSALSLLLWIAYLLADYAATFTLGRLTLHLDDPRHQLLLFWTPFLLLHLGGQETITAFSTEDTLLWKRHLLSLVSQVMMSIYIVTKSWHVVSTKQLMAPMVLMFIAGTIKYAERSWALMTAGSSMTPGSSSMSDYVLNVESNVLEDSESYFQRLHDFLSRDSRGRVDYEGLVDVAGKGIRIWLDFLTDMTPFLMWNKGDTIDRAIRKLRGLENPELRQQIGYKLAEIQLSLVYDFMYTKYGVLQYHLNLINSGVERLVTFGATTAALVLFLKADLHGQFAGDVRADVVVSYVLLAGAVALDLSSTFMVMSSFWPYLPGRSPFGKDGFLGKHVMFNLTKLVNPLGKRLWSGQMAQYNLIGECIHEKQANFFVWALRKVGLVSDVTHVQVSPDLKKFLFTKLLDIGTTKQVTEYWKWDFGTFSGQWARWALEATEEGRSVDKKKLNLEGGTVAAIVLMWHMTTEMCLYTTTDNGKDSSSMHRDMSRQLSEYVLYLVGKCGVKNGSNGHFEFGKLRRDVKKALAHQRFSGGRLEQSEVVLYGYEGHGFFTLRASDAAKELLKITRPAERWELIATVWTEMLCFLAQNCEAAFHIKNLTTGGEFVTHVRVLSIILGIPFIREAWQAQAKDDTEYSDFVMF
ncbi:hypothetical protein CFC21_099533 [Triticum aestivum]|uniref:DUF4220 domain-containing protein n=2 Tax=Triticum aestivum TaxID=4565 RepID=A0A9R1LZ27_WHEAT|nr:uncharacterized protein LOC123148871 [Triticum aestivum]KAF7097744.1 hypothetical protein CFC21_099532 [Triticum aestivum]KAF7097745.1 hypothetical protein CFC21_099533 [Triticum aestivum]